MSWVPSTKLEDDYERHNDTDDGRKFLGVISDDTSPTYYVNEEHRTGSGYFDEDGEFVTHPGSESPRIDAEEKLGEYLERVGEEHGWESLSEFAREHLEDEEASA